MAAKNFRLYSVANHMAFNLTSGGLGLNQTSQSEMIIRIPGLTWRASLRTQRCLQPSFAHPGYRVPHWSWAYPSIPLGHLTQLVCRFLGDRVLRGCTCGPFRPALSLLPGVQVQGQEQLQRMKPVEYFMFIFSRFTV